MGPTEKYSKRAEICALPPITDILGDRLARLVQAEGSVFIPYPTRRALPAPEQADKVLRSPCRLEIG